MASISTYTSKKDDLRKKLAKIEMIAQSLFHMIENVQTLTSTITVNPPQSTTTYTVNHTRNDAALKTAMKNDLQTAWQNFANSDG